MTAIYVIGNVVGPKKIGIAKNPGHRLHSLRSASAADVSILHSQALGDDAWMVEGHAHRILTKSRIRGEWFDVSLQAAIAAIDAAKACVANGEQVVRSVGRKKQWTERITLPMAEGTTARIDAALTDSEVRLDLIRKAIEAELKRREKAK